MTRNNVNFNQLTPSTSAKWWREDITVNGVLTLATPWLLTIAIALWGHWLVLGTVQALSIYIYIYDHLYPHNNLETGALFNPIFR